MYRHILRPHFGSSIIDSLKFNISPPLKAVMQSAPTQRNFPLNTPAIVRLSSHAANDYS